MSRHAVITGQLRDVFGRVWDIRDERETAHGFPIIFGWPADAPRGRGCIGPGVIPTPGLAAYLERMRLTPKEIDLPVGANTAKRLRKLLGHDWRRDNARWWEDHRGELLASPTLAEFCERHGKSQGAASMWRAAFGGKKYSHHR